MREIVFATANPNKVAEVARMVEGFTIKTALECGITEEIPEDRDTIEGNSLQKAEYLFNKLECDCFADDTGLEIEALGGEPGVRSARYAGEGKDSEDNMNLVLAKLEGESNRRARFRTVVTLFLGGEMHQFEGVVNGVITSSRSGHKGFGYDPIFRPDGYDITFAEMDGDIKNSISHRGRAIRALVEFLNSKR